MTHSMRAPAERVLTRGALSIKGLAVSALLFLPSASQTSVPAEHALRLSYQVSSSSSGISVKIAVKPQHDFDSVRVEAADGNTQMSPPCAFSNLVAGTAYECQVDVTGSSSEPALTLAIIGDYQVAGAELPQMEMQHVSVKNPAFMESSGKRPASKHILTRSASTR